MKCKKCGAENPDDAKTCVNCGAEIKKKNPALLILLVIVIVIAIFALALLIRYAIVKDSYFAPFQKMFGLEDEVDDDDKKKDRNYDDEEVDTKTKVASKKSLLSSKATAKGVDHYIISIDMEKLMDSVMQQLTSTMQNGMQTLSPTSKLNLTKVMDLNFDEDYYNDTDDSNDDIMLINEDEDEDNEIPEIYRRSTPPEDFNNDDDEDEDYTDPEYDSSTTVEERLEMLSDCLENLELTIDVYADENELIEILLTVEYSDALNGMYEIMKSMEEDGEDVPFSLDSYSEFEEDFEDRIEEYFTKDEMLEVFDSAIKSQEEDIDIDVYDYEENFDISRIDGGLEFYFRCNDEMNEQIETAIEENVDDTEDTSNYIELFMDTLDEEGSNLGISVEKE